MSGTTTTAHDEPSPRGTVGTEPPGAATDRRRRRLAVLAGGLVLGVGGASVLAAWTDDEFATGTFQGGSFDLEGSTDGTAYAQHPTAGGAGALAFTAPFDNLSPGDITSAAFAVRLAAGTTHDASVSIAVVTPDPVPPGNDPSNLEYAIVQTIGFGCETGPLDGGVQWQDTLVPNDAKPVFPLAAGPDDATPGEPAYFCIGVQALPGLAQGQTATATWQFAATSE